MKHDLTPAENYLLVVDNSEIKKGDWTWHPIKGVYKAAVDGAYTNQKKIIAHIPLKDSPVLEGVDLLPEIKQEDGVDEAEQMFTVEINSVKTSNKSHLEYLESGFVYGYIKAKEKYKYTEEDIYKAIQYGREVHYTNDQPFIQSLSQPKTPVGFECEMEHFYMSSKEFYKDADWVKCDEAQYRSIKEEIPTCPLKQLPKTTTNSQGQTVWVGKYIY